MLKKNDVIHLNVTSATAEGSGVGKTEDGMAVFVPLSAVGDALEVRILKVKKTYAFGKIERIVSPAATRITPDCPHFAQCGGCVWRHISYEEECRVKQQKVQDAVARIGGIDAPVKPIIPSERVLRYRNKAQLPVGTDKNGRQRDGGALLALSRFNPLSFLATAYVEILRSTPVLVQVFIIKDFEVVE